MNLLQAIESFISIIFGGCWDFIATLNVGSGLSYGAVLIGYLAIAFIICKFWKFGKGD